MAAVNPAKHSWNLSLQSVPLVNKGLYKDENIRVNALISKGFFDYTFQKESTLFEVFEHGMEEDSNAPCLGWRTNLENSFSWISYTEVFDRAQLLGSGLISLGARPIPTQLIGIFSQNRPEYKIVELACTCYSMVLVSLHDNLAIEQLQRILKHCKLKIIIVDKQARATNLLSCVSEMVSTNSLDLIIVMDDHIRVEITNIAQNNDIKILTFEEVQLEGQKQFHSLVAPKKDNLCSIFYTCGTTGFPKGVKISHKSMLSSAQSLCHYMLKLGSININSNDSYISYLPMSHIFERLCQVIIIFIGARIGFFQGEPQHLVDDLRMLQPTILPAVPSVLYRFREMIMLPGSLNAFTEFLLRKALKSKQRLLKNGTITTKSFWDKIILRKSRMIFGGKVRLCIVGSAPVSFDVIEFMRTLGISIVQGYGLTETSGIVSIGHPSDFSTGSVGPPMVCNIVKLIDVPERNFFVQDKVGEICVKGSNLFNGYFKEGSKKQEKSVLDDDGYFHTGDIGMWLPNGALRILDRVSYTFRTASGNYIAPEKIENVLVQSPMVHQAYIHGSDQCHFVVAVIVPEVNHFNKWCQDKGLADISSNLYQTPIVKSLFLSDVDSFCLETKLKEFELPKKLHLTERRFAFENDMLTFQGKPRRVVIYKTYKKEIDEMLAVDRSNAY